MVVLPFRSIGSGVSIGPHQRLNGVEEICLSDVTHAAFVNQQELHQLHGECHGHVVEPVLHGLKRDRCKYLMNSFTTVSF